MTNLMRHYLFGHFRWFVCALAGAATASLVVLSTDNRELFFFAGGMQITWTLLALGGLVIGAVEVIRCRRNIRGVDEIDEAFEPVAMLQREQDMSDAGPPLVQRVDGGFRITWISPDNVRTFAMAMSTEHAHELASKLHEGLYG